MLGTHQSYKANIVKTDFIWRNLVLQFHIGIIYVKTQEVANQITIQQAKNWGWIAQIWKVQATYFDLA